MTEQNTADLMNAVASQLTLALEAFRMDGHPGVPVDDSEQVRIDRITYEDGDTEAWLRLTNGTTWILRAHELGNRILGESEVGLKNVLKSIQVYKNLQARINETMRAVTAAGLDTDHVLQAWHDDVLTDEERAHWNRWISGGYATAAEWEAVDRYS